MQSAKHKIRYWNEALQGTLSLMLSTSNAYITKTVDELLFKGYEDSLIEMGRLAVSGEDIPPFDKFGWFYMVGRTDRNKTSVSPRKLAEFVYLTVSRARRRSKMRFALL